MREDGKLLFGTNYGLIVIDPEKIQDNETFSPVVFTDLYVNGTQMNPQMEDSPLKQSLAYSDEITLKFFQNSFLIDFSTFDYSDSGHTKNICIGWKITIRMECSFSSEFCFV